MKADRGGRTWDPQLSWARVLPMAVVLTHDESSRLRALHALGLGPELEPELQGIAAIAAQLFGTPRACFHVVDRDRVWAKAHFGGASELPRGESLCEHLLDGAGTLVVSDARADARFARPGRGRGRGRAPLLSREWRSSAERRAAAGRSCALGPDLRSGRPRRSSTRYGLLGKRLTAVLELPPAARADAARAARAHRSHRWRS